MAYIEEWQERVEVVKARLEPKIRKLLNILRDLILAENLQCSPVEDLTCDDYEWEINIHTKPVPEAEVGKWVPGTVGVKLSIEESLAHDATDKGINFQLVVEKFDDREGDGGCVECWRCSPYNFTEQVWVSVDDEAAVDQRWEDFHSLVINGFDASNPAVCLLV